MRRMEEVKVVKTSMEEGHGNKMKGKTRQRQREGKRTTRTHTTYGVKISACMTRRLRLSQEMSSL